MAFGVMPLASIFGVWRDFRSLACQTPKLYTHVVEIRKKIRQINFNFLPTAFKNFKKKSSAALIG